jgi:hypothetical protein
MYAMLAGKLPFKVENRSKNLAKLHACILKGFEVPQFLSPGNFLIKYFRHFTESIIITSQIGIDLKKKMCNDF